MRSFKVALLAVIPASALLLGAPSTGLPISGDQAAGVPAQPPRINPQPPQSLPQPPQSLPQPPQSLPQPAQTTPPSPDQPAPQPAAPGTPPGANPAAQPDTEIVDPADPRLTPQQREYLVRIRATRPFTLQSAQSEAVFYGGVQHLVRDEQRFGAACEDQLRRLGEIRGMSGERQTAALLDLLQQVLITNRDLHQYLVRSRSAWSGEMPVREQSTGESPRNTPDGQVLPQMLK